MEVVHVAEPGPLHEVDARRLCDHDVPVRAYARLSAYVEARHPFDVAINVVEVIFQLAFQKIGFLHVIVYMRRVGHHMARREYRGEQDAEVRFRVLPENLDTRLLAAWVIRVEVRMFPRDQIDVLDEYLFG